MHAHSSISGPFKHFTCRSVHGRKLHRLKLRARHQPHTVHTREAKKRIIYCTSQAAGPSMQFSFRCFSKIETEARKMKPCDRIDPNPDIKSFEKPVEGGREKIAAIFALMGGGRWLPGCPVAPVHTLRRAPLPVVGWVARRLSCPDLWPSLLYFGADAKGKLTSDKARKNGEQIGEHCVRVFCHIAG
ncbi:hypothetical protein GQ53DRAFT_329474 [Thozetella sp. PMI_491]|nr:hypothetical protein GQ53DRAFT_329474 [Thozetella sp. PMI_491]